MLECQHQAAAAAADAQSSDDVWDCDHADAGDEDDGYSKVLAGDNQSCLGFAKRLIKSSVESCSQSS